MIYGGHLLNPSITSYKENTVTDWGPSSSWITFSGGSVYVFSEAQLSWFQLCGNNNSCPRSSPHPHPRPGMDPSVSELQPTCSTPPRWFSPLPYLWDGGGIRPGLQKRDGGPEKLDGCTKQESVMGLGPDARLLDSRALSEIVE